MSESIPDPRFTPTGPPTRIRVPRWPSHPPEQIPSLFLPAPVLNPPVAEQVLVTVAPAEPPQEPINPPPPQQPTKLPTPPPTFPQWITHHNFSTSQTYLTTLLVLLSTPTSKIKRSSATILQYKLSKNIQTRMKTKKPPTAAEKELRITIIQLLGLLKQKIDGFDAARRRRKQAQAEGRYAEKDSDEGWTEGDGEDSDASYSIGSDEDDYYPEEEQDEEEEEVSDSWMDIRVEDGTKSPGRLKGKGKGKAEVVRMEAIEEEEPQYKEDEDERGSTKEKGKKKGRAKGKGKIMATAAQVEIIGKLVEDENSEREELNDEEAPTPTVSGNVKPIKSKPVMNRPVKIKPTTDEDPLQEQE